MKLVLASNNAKKLVELQALFAPLGVELVAQGSLGIAEAEEPFETFAENALAKARHAARASGLPALADDSGLSVDALGGAPGVRSARYALDAGGEKGDAANNERLLRELAGREDRTARFVCALVAVRGAADPEPLVAMGRWPGRILTAPRGTGGFGYDPLMFIPPLCRAVAELGAGEKNIHSHRALAAGELVRQMREVWKLG
ncbi:RdgB/HAM1 family non-canonical purine NTP pyrophosphatase [Pelomonas aquatica]|jgi:XTP/dITP diphosphohydrolase|uniref:dITP/XTP pyrophosphatase n=1 Tax=Pelomonas aquatica TaxID=431058 RepID=A0A9X4LDG6_9BURK|nr:RdgB/HAM1 family non-canonical purine NTP pyrophosphatase [Pelomonas aquatica]MCY4754801.1 RdgB/HAM1 family non-canonical purine NTP pyrophosphatase [Pelomonas aquatica]MDG0861886.1 RdgB/HAM1 family non-canonical purine NTP pyrophosphatase [Pelomonas aquatica]